MKMTKESLLKIICAADEVISALAGTNDEVNKDDTDKMIHLWDDLNDRYAPPEVVRELARMALAAMDSEPVVPEEMEIPTIDGWENESVFMEMFGRATGWNACRAAMLNGGKS